MIKDKTIEYISSGFQVPGLFPVYTVGFTDKTVHQYVWNQTRSNLFQALIDEGYKSDAVVASAVPMETAQ